MRLILVLFAGAALLALGGCASSVAVTGPQKVYALESEFDLAEQAIIAYEASPESTPTEIAKIRTLNAAAHQALVVARTAVQAQDAAADPAVTNAALAAAQTAIGALDSYLQAREVRK